MAFKLTEKLGYSPPFNFQEGEDSLYNYIWVGVIEYEKLFSRLREGASFDFNHTPYLIGQKTQLGNYGLNHDRFKKFILGDDTRYYLPSWYISKSSQKPLKIGENSIYLDGFLSPYNKKVNPKDVKFNSNLYIKKDTEGIIFKDDIYEGYVKFRMLFPFEDYQKDNSLYENYAIIIESERFNEFEAVLNYLGITPPNSFYQEIKNRFNTVFNAVTSSKQLEFLYNIAPQFVLQEIPIDTRWKHLFQLLSYFVLDNREKGILNLLRSLAGESYLSRDDQESKDEFRYRVNKFFKMLSLHKNGESVFKKLYAKMNDYGFGGDHFTELIQILYNFWLLSDYSKPDYKRNIKDYKGGPEVLVYDTQKVLGFYNSDFNFNFVQKPSRIKIEVIKTDITYEKSKYSRRPHRKVTKTPMGEYELFHPIVLADPPKGGELKAPPTNVFPAFYLKAFNDKLKWSNIDKGVWLAVDVVTTFTGVGNLLKLRYLRHLANLKKVSTLFKLKMGVSIIEVTSGTLNILLTLSNEETEFGQKLRQYLFWLEISSLGVDAVVSKLLKKSAKEALDAADLYTDYRVVKHLSEVVGSSALFAKRVAKTLDNAPEAIKSFEKRISKFDVEYGKVYNKNTRVDEIHTSNLKDRISWPDRIRYRMRQAILTHNHPKGSGISIDDIKFMLSNRLNEIRAVGPNGSVFSLKNIKIKVVEMEDLIFDIEKIENKYFLAKKISVESTKVVDYREFKEIFELIKDKVEYLHYVE